MLFCDVVGSTALGESTDPEALRALLARYFKRMRGVVEKHGGSVEKFIGDAVMAVFGVPAAHEDDALRACRAASEMRDAFGELGVEGRIGVNTGEVITGTEERLATGDAVNVAARLQQAAQPDEVLIGEETLKLVRGAVETAPVEPLELKGKSHAVPAHRLVAVLDAPERSHDSVFVGREAEIAQIREAWERAQAEQRCELVTVVGDAGIGKSRLAAEAVAEISARSVRSRCLPYGEGITFWPVVEVLKQLDALPSDPGAAAAIRSVLGETDEGTNAEEIAWAFRKLLEEQSPLVVVFDDIQWGDETFLDLVEGVALLSAGAPILLVCLARAELLSRRSEWSVTLRLEPLPEQAVEELIGDAPAALRNRIAVAAGGNPLFVTQMLAMAEEDSEVDVPPTLRALLAARLDQLDAPERYVLERGAVEGEIFHRAAVQALAPDEPQVTPRLAALVRRQLIRPDQAQLPGEDGFRFRHLLIRDAAYDALSKATRAELHERFADWLEQRGADLVELDEILGHHFEQAARYKSELEQADTALAERAAQRLAAAGRRALGRGDDRAAASLLERALTLTRPLKTDVHVEVDLAQAVRSDPRRATRIADDAAERAAATGDREGEALARVVSARFRLEYEDTVDELDALAREALPLLEQANDHAGLAHVWNAFSEAAKFRGHWGEHGQALERALHHARLAGWQTAHPFDLVKAYILGPEPADEVLRGLDRLMPELSHPLRLLVRARLLAMLDRLDEAWPAALEASERLLELTGDDGGEGELGQAAAVAGDHETAARYLRVFCNRLERLHLLNNLSSYAPMLGRSLCALGRYDEAEPLAEQGRDLGHDEDLLTQALWRQVQARVLSQRGAHADAVRLAREAVEYTKRSDGLNLQGDALCDLAEVLAAAGRGNEAAATLEQALDRYERKKNLAQAAQARDRLAELRDAAPR